VEQFLDLNAKIGGWDVDGNQMPQRTVATMAAVQNGYRVLTSHGIHGQTIQLARSLADVDATLRTARNLMIVLIAGAAVAAGAAGRLVAVAGLRPIQRITLAATQIATTRELVRPIPADGTDEVAELGQAFNQMIIALDHAQQAQRELIEDAAHELRTPMSSLRTNLELLIHAGARLSVADRQALLSDLHKQSIELSNLVTDVVDLARSKTADKPAEPVDLVSLAADAIDRARIRSPHARLALHCPPSAIVGVQPTVIERALVNLLDNAVKFGPPDQTIDVHIATVGAGRARFTEISVADRATTISRGPAATRLPAVPPARRRTRRTRVRARSGNSPPGGDLARRHRHRRTSPRRREHLPPPDPRLGGRNDPGRRRAEVSSSPAAGRARARRTPGRPPAPARRRRGTAP
jgi:two-component system sensor histidine kinase MprB